MPTTAADSDLSAEPCDDLHWDSESVEKVLRRNNIHTRADLAVAIGKPYSTVCRSIEADWSGSVSTTSVLAAMCRTFDVPISRLVHEPRQTNTEGETPP